MILGALCAVVLGFFSALFPEATELAVAKCNAVAMRLHSALARGGRDDEDAAAAPRVAGRRGGGAASREDSAIQSADGGWPSGGGGELVTTPLPLAKAAAGTSRSRALLVAAAAVIDAHQSSFPRKPRRQQNPPWQQSGASNKRGRFLLREMRDATRPLKVCINFVQIVTSFLHSNLDVPWPRVSTRSRAGAPQLHALRQSLSNPA